MAFEYDPNIALNQANEEEQYAQQNNDFWREQYNKFNPQQTVLQNPNSGKAYQNVANQANSMAQTARQVGGGGGSLDYGRLGQNLSNEGQQVSKTEDLNSFLNNLRGNKNMANERLTSMFGNTQNSMAQQARLNQLPNQRAMSGAETQQEIENAWRNYYNGQPNTANMIGGALGHLAGGIAGNKLGSLFAQPTSYATPESYDWENDPFLKSQGGY